MPGFLGFAIDVRIAEQAFVRSVRSSKQSKPDNHNMHMRLATCVRPPGEGAVSEGDFEFVIRSKEDRT